MYNGARESKKSPAQYPPMYNHIILPAGIETPGLLQENETKHPVTKILEEDDKPYPPDSIARSAIRGLERGDYMITTQFLGHLMRASMMGGSPRNGWGISDTVMGWITYIAWLFIGPDMERKVYKYGVEHGLDGVCVANSGSSS